MVACAAAAFEARGASNDRGGACPQAVLAEIASACCPAHTRAFPSGWHDRLLKTAAHSDDEIAFRHASSWLAANDVRTASPRDRRLLLAVVARFGERLRSQPAYPELVALQKTLWAGTKMALFEALPALRRIKQAGIDLMLIKGVARLATDRDSIRSRAADDIDIVVRPTQGRDALDILASEGWEPNKGISALYLREHLLSTRSTNLLKGKRGDIDLHTSPFRPGQGGKEDDEELWMRAAPATLSGVAVSVPAAEDALALAIAHGSLEGHHRSDWLVDCARLVAQGQISWERLEAILVQRRLVASAHIVVDYISNVLGHDVPEETLRRLGKLCKAEPLIYLSAFLLARPTYRASPLGRAAARVAWHWHRGVQMRNMPPREPDRLLRVRRRAIRKSTGSTPPTLQHAFDLPAGSGDHLHLRGSLLLAVPGVRRRIELEINGTRHHLCRLSYRKLTAGPETMLLEFDGVFPVPEGETRFVLESRPTRRFRAERQASDRYRSIPFCLCALELERIS